LLNNVRAYGHDVLTAYFSRVTEIDQVEERIEDNGTPPAFQTGDSGLIPGACNIMPFSIAFPFTINLCFSDLISWTVLPQSIILLY
jgi:hypothetical protein